MKVSLYPEKDGTFSVLIQASPGKGKAPVVIPNVARKDIKGKVLPAIDAIRGPKNPRLPTL